MTKLRQPSYGYSEVYKLVRDIFGHEIAEFNDLYVFAKHINLGDVVDHDIDTIRLHNWLKNARDEINAITEGK